MAGRFTVEATATQQHDRGFGAGRVVGVMRRRITGLALCAFACATPALAQDTFQGIGVLPGNIPGRVAGISDDGSTLTVSGDVPGVTHEAFIWRDGVLTYLGAIDPTEPISTPTGIAADGSVVIGTSTNEFGYPEGFRWEGGTFTRLGYLDGTFPGSNANAISADGTTIVGDSYVSSHQQVAVRWNGTTIQSLGLLPDATLIQSDAVAVSADGSFVVGYSGDANSNSQAVRWNASGTPLGLGFIDPLVSNPSSFAQAVSANGSIVVGYGSSQDGIGTNQEAFRWTEATGMVGLGFLYSGSNAYSIANLISADGSTIVGSATPSDAALSPEAVRWQGDAITPTPLGFLDETDNHRYSIPTGVSADGSVIVGYSLRDARPDAFRWTEAGGMQSVQLLLEDAGVDLTDWQLQAATGVSASGVTIVGYGLNPDGNQEGWIARFGDEPGLLDPEAAYQSIASLQDVGQSIDDRLGSVLGSQLSFAEHSNCGGAFACTFASVSANQGDGLTGLAGGVMQIAPDWIAGLGGGYGVERTTLIEGGSADLNFPTATAILAHIPDRGPLFAASATAMWIDADIDRGYMNGNGSATSHGSTDGEAYGARARFGWVFKPTDTLAVTPFAEYEADHYHLAGYTESGGPFPATIGATDSTTQVTRLGSDMRFDLGQGVSIWGGLDWAHRFGDAAPAISAQLTDLFAVNVPANGTGPDWMEIRGGVGVPTPAKGKLTADVVAAVFSSTVPTVGGDVTWSRRF
jgi:probable HAF family extracellular repeat protein